jgi:hypothetical protein
MRHRHRCEGLLSKEFPERLTAGHDLPWETSPVSAAREEWADVVRAARAVTGSYVPPVQAVSPEAITDFTRAHAAKGNR